MTTSTSTSECARSWPRATEPYTPTATRFRPSRVRSSPARVFASSSRREVAMPGTFRDGPSAFPPVRCLYGRQANPRDHDAPYPNRSRRVRCEEIGQVVHGEARLRNPGPSGPLDHGGPEEREHGLSPVRGILSPGTGELRDLLRVEERQEGRRGVAQARRPVHDPDDEGRLGHLRDVQGSRRKRVLAHRGVAASRSWTNPAVRAARAMMEIIGFTPGAVGSRLPSPIHRFRTSWHSPVGPAADVLGSSPALAEPIGWAENRAIPFSWMPRRPNESTKPSNSAPRIGDVPSP